VNWIAFIVVAYIFEALQQGLAPAMAIRSRFGSVEPRFDLALLAMVGLFATGRLTVWIWALAGLLVDLLAVYAGGKLILGPNALGYIAGAYIVLQVRMLVLRTHPISLAFTVVCSGAAAMLVTVAVFSIRNWYDPLPGYSAVAALAADGLGLIYSAIVALLLAWPLIKIAPWLGLPTAKVRR
jgi:hypothetical protein